MARFTVRVELHDATQDDYERLQELMQAAGFFRTIKGEDGTKFHLPSSEYNFEGSIDINTVRERAKGAARGTRRDFDLLVTESIRRRWYNLRQAQ